MASLTNYVQDPTVQAIYQAIEAASPQAYRTYLGASRLGDPCARKLWLEFRWVTRPKFNGRILRLFNTGHLEEPRLINDLRATGIDVMDVDPVSGKQWAVSFFGGHCRGHADGAALGIHAAPKTWHLLEFKTHNDKSFNSLTADGVRQSKPEHYVQMQLYMHGLELTRAYYLARNKNTDELYGERIHYDSDAAQNALNRAERIIFSSEPPAPISQKPSWYQCKNCDMHPFCHAGEQSLPDPLPDMNCRTCIHSTPERNGTWSCQLGHAIGQPCDDHRWLPMLFPALTYEDVELGAGEVVESVYYSADGLDFMNNAAGELVKC